MNNFSIQYVYELIDKFTPIAQKIEASTKKVATTMAMSISTTKAYYKEHLEGLDKMSKRMMQTGRSMSLWLTAPIVGLGAISIRGFAQTEQGLAIVGNLLKSNKDLMGISKEEIKKLSDSFVQMGYDGSDILNGVTTTLAKFPGLTRDTFERTHSTVVNISAATKKSLEEVSQGLGKALTQPNAVKLLKDLGTGLDPVIAKQFETLRKHNPAKAQIYLLEQLDKKFAGSAEAAAKAGLGPLKVLKATFTGVAESFSPFIVSYLDPLLKKAKALLDYMNDLSPSTKNMIVNFAGLLAVLGPLVLIIGTLTKAYVILATAQKLFASTSILTFLATESKWLLIHIRSFGILRGIIYSINAAMIANPTGAIIIGISAGIAGIVYGAKLFGKILSTLPIWLEQTYDWIGKIIMRINPLYGLFFKLAANNSSAIREQRQEAYNTQTTPGIGQYIGDTMKFSSNQFSSARSDVFVTIDDPSKIVKKVTTKKKGIGNITINKGYGMVQAGGSLY